VQGISWTEVTVTGQSAHAGTTPMPMRHDALAVAARVIHEIRSMAGYFGAPQVATVGRLDVVPNLVNVVPSKVVFSIDLRNTDEEVLQNAEREAFGACNSFAADEGCEVSMRTLARFEPVDFDSSMVDLVEATAQRLGHSTRRMPSGAGHDAQILGLRLPAAMMFVPSIGGISHHFTENTADADIVLGCQVFADAAAKILKGN
jgi:beta-ureidopropionase / N-carbamoyl-L-amino-acid hydrolase